MPDIPVSGAPSIPLGEYVAWFEQLDVPGLKRLGLEAATAAQQTHDTLGDAGRELVVPTHVTVRHAIPLRAELACEVAVLDVFRASRRSFRYVTRCLGSDCFGADPQFTLVIDGLNGVTDYVVGGRDYGTMFAVFPGVRPRYRDSVFSAVLQHAQHRWVVMESGEGVYLYTDGVRQPGRIFTCGQSALQREVRTVPPGPPATRIAVDVRIGRMPSIEGEPMRTFFADPFKEQGYKYNDQLPFAGQVMGLLRDELDLVCTGSMGNLGLLVAAGLMGLGNGSCSAICGPGASRSLHAVSSEFALEFARHSCVPFMLASTPELANSAFAALRRFWPKA